MATANPSRSIAPVVVEVRITVKALAFPEPEGGYWVVVPEIPGCVTQGEDIDEVRAMAAELAEALLDMAHERERGRATRDLLDPLPLGRGDAVKPVSGKRMGKVLEFLLSLRGANA